MRILTKPRLAAVGAFLAVLVLAGLFEGFARAQDLTEARASVAERLDRLTRTMSDMVARETASVDTMAAFVEIAEYDRRELSRTFPLFSEALMHESPTIRSVQMAPDAILDFVYPLEGNEAALGLDLLADPDRRVLLVPSITTGATTVQGPVELVQGGTGLIVRKPVYRSPDEFWGFAVVLLDWPSVVSAVGFDPLPSDVVAGIRHIGSSAVIAGDPNAFEGRPLLRTVQVGATATTWVIAMRPAEGWPATSHLFWPIVFGGLVVAIVAAIAVHGIVRRPELLEGERRAALDDLARSEARFQATFLHAGVGIVIGDVHGRLVSANPAFHELVGLPGESLEGMSVVGFVAEEDRRTFERHMLRAYRGHEAVGIDIRTVTPGAPRWARVQVTTIPGDARLLVGIVEDITDRLVAAKALTDSEDRFRRLFEHAPIAIQREDHSAAKAEIDRLVAAGVTDLRAWFEEDEARLLDVLGRVTITDLNPEAESLQLRLGVSPGKGGSLTLHYTTEAMDGFISTMEAIAANRHLHEYSMLTLSGSETMSLDLTWQVPVVDGVPDYSNLMLTLQDTTKLRETERRLKEEVESKDRFIASVAHELRTPLTAVVGFAHELQDETGLYGEDERKEFQRLIAHHSGELAHLIEDLLVWARADIGQVQVKPVRLDLGACVAQAVDAMPEIDVPVDWMSARTIAVADASRVRQIVRNLVLNAVRYGGPDARVDVFDEGGWAIVEVSDDGGPLSEEDLEHMFAPYARSERSPSMPGSIGLGLTVSRTLSRLQHGDLVFRRRGQRNVFRLTLPLDVPA